MKNKYTRLLSYLLRNQLPYWYGTFKSQDYKVIKQNISNPGQEFNGICWRFLIDLKYCFDPHGDINYPELQGPDEWYNGEFWFNPNDKQSRLDKLDEAINSCYGLPMIQLFGMKIYNIVFP